MTALQAFILGIVQGVAEFLPISSSGHLIVLQRVFGITEPLLTFDIVVHIGSLLAILIVFWPKVVALLKDPLGKSTRLLLVGTIPAVVAGFLLRDFVENYLRTGIWLGIAFFITGLLLTFADKQKAKATKADITYKDALVIGICQALALPPGISRSGTTIAGALGRGINRQQAAEFSFMLAMIAIAGAGVLEIFTAEAIAMEISFIATAIGFVTSLVVGIVSIKLLLKLIGACKLKYFAWYVWGLGGLILIDYFILGRFF